MADPWRGDTTLITADETPPTADGSTGSDQWTADTDHFTVDDNSNHTADGWHNDDLGWTADTTHFTVDDDTNHTADGWHVDTTEEVEEKGKYGGMAVELYRWKRLREEDDALMAVIETFLDKAA